MNIMLNKQRGNMYKFATHTWNPIRGKCSHDCSYCSIKGIAKRFNRPQKPIRLVEKELNTKLGKGNFIFVGSSTDMFADSVHYNLIVQVLKVCKKYPDNKYLFQTKNPKRLKDFTFLFPKNSIMGITLETNRNYDLGNAPPIMNRVRHFSSLRWEHKMITIEPIVDFDLNLFVIMIKEIEPEWVNIGADSKGHNLSEPSKEKILALVDELKEFTEVKIKPNLKRIVGEHYG